MATITCTATALSVSFTASEKVAGLLLRDLAVPRSAITELVVEPDGLRAVKGVRAPGLGVPGLRRIGTWRRRAGGRTVRTVVSVRAGQPAVRIRLRDVAWDELLIGQDDAWAVAAALGLGDRSRGDRVPCGAAGERAR